MLLMIMKHDLPSSLYEIVERNSERNLNGNGSGLIVCYNEIKIKLTLKFYIIWR